MRTSRGGEGRRQSGEDYIEALSTPLSRPGRSLYSLVPCVCVWYVLFALKITLLASSRNSSPPSTLTNRPAPRGRIPRPYLPLHILSLFSFSYWHSFIDCFNIHSRLYRHPRSQWAPSQSPEMSQHLTPPTSRQFSPLQQEPRSLKPHQHSSLLSRSAMLHFRIASG